MPLSIGVNLRVTGHCNQGGRKYMEDMFSVAFQSTPDDKDLEYAFFGIFDGHGGGEAASFAKEHLMNVIVKQKNFWSDRDEDVLRAIREGYVTTHYAMWRELDKWPRTASGLPSTAGTTASIAFIRKGKIYIGHVGDSGIILGYQVDGDPQWQAKALTKDHKPESGPEMVRIRESGGKVVSKSGVPRVVWNRPRIGHKGPVRRSTHIDEIPFLAVARSLGDLWSYNSELDTFVVSPEPDVKVVAIDVESHRCLIFGTDGLWNMLTPQAAVAIVQAADRHNEKHLIASQQTCNGQADNVQLWINPSKSLVDGALERWSSKRLRADNTSVVTLMLDPSGPSRSEKVLLGQKDSVMTNQSVHTPASTVTAENEEKPAFFPVVPTILRAPILKPNFQNKIEPDKQETCSEKIVHVKKENENIDVARTLQKETAQTNCKESYAEENIEVAKTTSGKEVENISGTSDKLKAETLEILDAEETKAIRTRHEVAVAPMHQNVTRSRQTPELEDNEIDQAGASNVMRRSAISGEVDEKHSFARVASNLPKNNGVISENGPTNENEVKPSVLNGSRNKRRTLFSASRTEIRNARRRHSLSSHSRNTLVESGTMDAKTYGNSRFRLRSTKVSVTGSAVEAGVRNYTSKTTGSAVGTKRRHSAISQSVVSTVEETTRMLQEPCAKRRTRSEDRRNPVDENDPANQTTKDASSSLGWSAADYNIARSTGTATTVPVQEKLSSLNTFQRNMGKKASPVKSHKRQTIKGLLKQLWVASISAREWEQGKNNRLNSCSERRINRGVSIIGSPDVPTVPQRWLRSDTMAAANPIKTLRSRNVDLNGHTISVQSVNQYGLVKQNRLSLPSKLKQSNNNGFMQSSRVRSSSLSSIKQSNSNAGNGTCSTINSSNTGCSNSGMAKRVKSPYNPSARSLTTRSRIKRLGK